MRTNKFFLVISLLFFTLAAQAAYQLESAESSLHFVSIKKGKIGEVHSFGQLSGGISDKAVAQVSIGLASVNTNIGIRDERMKTMLLETGVFPAAVVTVNLGAVQLASIGVGDVVVKTLELTLELHGKSKLMQAEVQIVGLNNGALLVNSIKPIMLNAFDFGLNAGIHKLMEVAKLPSIATAVPVSFSLVFKPQ